MSNGEPRALLRGEALKKYAKRKNKGEVGEKNSEINNDYVPLTKL